MERDSEVQIFINPHLPINEIPLEWGEVFYQIANVIDIDGYFFTKLEKDLGFKKYINLYLPRKWGMLMGWVIKKKWLPDLQIHFDEETVRNIINNNNPIYVMPLEERVVNSFESLGEYLYRILELCIACYHSPHFPNKYSARLTNYQNKEVAETNICKLQNLNNKYIYDSEVDLFFQVMNELKQAELYRCLYRSYPHLFEHQFFKKYLDEYKQDLREQQETIKQEKKGLKKNNKYYTNQTGIYAYSPLPQKHENQIVKDECSKMSKSLRKLINPYREDIEPHIYCLIDSAIDLAGKDINWKQKNYSPFLDSMAWMNKVKREGFKSKSRGRKPISKGLGVTIFIEGEHIGYSQGKGKGKYISY